MKRLLASCLTLSCALTLPVAHASDQADWPRTEHVTYDPHALASPAGIAAVESRIEVAARRVCADLDRQELQAQARYRQCYAHALNEAMLKLRSAESLVAAATGPAAPR